MLPGYHMNKRHWNTVIVDGRLSGKQIRNDSIILSTGERKKKWFVNNGKHEKIKTWRMPAVWSIGKRWLVKYSWHTSTIGELPNHVINQSADTHFVSILPVTAFCSDSHSIAVDNRFEAWFLFWLPWSIAHILSCASKAIGWNRLQPFYSLSMLR